MAPTKEALKLSLSHNLKTMAWEQEITPQEIADRLEVNGRSVRRWWSGGALPSLDNLYRLAELLGTTTRSLLREVEQGAQAYPEGTLEACNYAVGLAAFERPLTGVLCDYLCVATAVKDVHYRSAWLALNRMEIGTERLLLSRGAIYTDGRIIGRLKRSQGQPVNGARKILWHFTGLAFRPPCSSVGGTGGAGLTPRECYDFIKKCVLAVVSHARQRVAELSGEDDIEIYVQRHEGQRRASQHREALFGYAAQLRGRSPSADYLQAVSQDLADLADGVLRDQQDEEAAFWRGRWSDLIEWPISATNVERLDLAVEVAVKPGFKVADLRGVSLPHQMGWRSQIASQDGRTEYAGRRKDPLAARGEAPLLTAYTKAERPGVLRLEVRLPRVTYHNASKSMGVVGAAQWALDVFEALLPWGVELGADGLFHVEPDQLVVPVLNLGTLACVVSDDTGEIPVRPYSGHEAKTARRLLRQGITLVKRYAAIYILANALAQGPARAELIDTPEYTETQPRTGAPHEIAAHHLIDLDDIYDTLTGLEAYRRCFYSESEGYQVWANRGPSGADELARQWVRERLGGDVPLEWPGAAERVGLAGEPGSVALANEFDGQLWLEPAQVLRDDTGA